jgi:hypothetical protein
VTENAGTRNNSAENVIVSIIDLKLCRANVVFSALYMRLGSTRESQGRTLLGLRRQLLTTMLVSAGTTWVALGVVILARGTEEGITAVAVGIVTLAIGIMTRHAGRKANAALAGASQQ